MNLLSGLNRHSEFIDYINNSGYKTFDMYWEMYEPLKPLIHMFRIKRQL